MAKVREKAEMKWLGEFAKQFGIKPELYFAAYDEMSDHFLPDTVRSDPTILKEAFEKMREFLNDLEDEMVVDIPTLMADGGLDPSIRSDSAKTRQFLVQSGLVAHVKGTPEHWVKRIENKNGSNGSV